jgi:phosphate starvation-inducible PhoH-like protein
MDPWTRPIFDILLEYYSQKDIDSMLNGGVIEISPLGYMRGRTFKRAFILADEMQNSSPNQMLMLVTRIGEDSKMVITGDLKQSDRGRDNGLVDFLGKVKAAGPSQGFGYVELGTSDVQRSAIVARVLDMYSPAPVIKAVSDIANKEKIQGAIQTLLREPDAAKKKDATKKIHPEHDAAMLPSYEVPKNDMGKRV